MEKNGVNDVQIWRSRGYDELYNIALVSKVFPSFYFCLYMAKVKVAQNSCGPWAHLSLIVLDIPLAILFLFDY